MYLFITSFRVLQSASVSLPGVTFNSKYWVEVEGEMRHFQRVYFYTPRCESGSPGQPLTACVHPAKGDQNTINTAGKTRGYLR